MGLLVVSSRPFDWMMALKVYLIIIKKMHKTSRPGTEIIGLIYQTVVKIPVNMKIHSIASKKLRGRFLSKIPISFENLLRTLPRGF